LREAAEIELFVSACTHRTAFRTDNLAAAFRLGWQDEFFVTVRTDKNLIDPL
jgi:hypothetical protein